MNPEFCSAVFLFRGRAKDLSAPPRNTYIHTYLHKYKHMD